MASKSSFDVTTGVDLQEVDNAVNQAHKEIQHRYDFRGTHCTLELDRASGVVRLGADDEFRLQALGAVFKEKLSRRGVPLSNVRFGEHEAAAGQAVRCTVSLTQGIDQDTARRIVKLIKEDGGFKKIQASIHGDQVRVTGPKKDELQRVMQLLREHDFGMELSFGNYRD